MHTPRVMLIVAAVALATLSSGCISNMPELKEALGYAKAPPPLPVYLPPIAKATVSANTALVGAPLRFTNDGSRDAQGLAIESSWSFGDGAGAIGPAVTHTYAKPGDFTIRLIVTNAAGLMDQASLALHVAAVPTAAFTITPVTGAKVGDKVALDPSGSSSPGGGALTYAWDFGDGATSLDAKPTHAYAAPGLYAIKLRVTDATGASAEAASPLAVSGEALRAAGHFDITGSDSASYAFAVPTGAREVTATLTFDRGAAGVNDLSLVVKDAAGKVVAQGPASGSAAPDPMPGDVTVKLLVPADALAKSAPGPWTATVQRGATMTPTGVDFTLTAAESF